ncbi:zinc-ribbon domain-containing protein [Sphingosinicella sp. YJ22]|uniref:zinc-ribbon domain-containing protein n=1 Tax=Sphingosinicella sp. YJ22 TaxID=1104780 RepID=UPI001408A5C3|nr:zinc-ribbon domain-containing protein [Sphingosinicella sp. YJ22]
MILTCPSCRARYAVPDGAISGSGRKVRCAKCRFSWVQEAPEDSFAPGEPAVPPRVPVNEPAVDEPAPPPAAAPAPEPAPEPEPEAEFEAPEDEAPPEWVGDHDMEIDEEPRRRRRLRFWPIAAVVAALLIVGAAAASYFVGWGEIGERLGLASASAQALEINGRVSREPGPAETELLTVTGEIRNLTDDVQRVPQIRAELLDGTGRVVYAWSIAPPRAQLQPREAVTFYSASTDVPPGGQNLNLSFAPLT